MGKRTTGWVKRDKRKGWYARVSYTDESGKRYYVRRYTYADQLGNRWKAQTKTEAAEALKQILSDLEHSPESLTEGSGVTLNAFLRRWLEDAAKPRVGARTYRDYTELLERYVIGKRESADAEKKPRRGRNDRQIIPVTGLGRRKLADVRPLDVQNLYAKMLELGLSSRTVRFVHAILNSAFKQAVRWGLLSKSPTVMVELPKREHKEMKALTTIEAARFLEGAKQEKWGLVFTLALLTGMRPSEYLALQWRDIDLDRGFLSVRRTLSWNRSGGGWYFDEPKTARSRRLIPLPSVIVRYLKEHKRAQRAEQLKAGANWQSLNLVFATSTGGPLLDRNLSRRHFKNLLRRVKLPTTIRLYDLRHSLASLMLSQGENPKVVSERLGHASTVLTMDTYSHVLPSLQQEATTRLENLLFAAPRRSRKARGQ